MPHLGLSQAVAVFLGMKFFGVEEAAHTPEADVADLNDLVPFQGDIQIIAETATARAYNGFVPDSHGLLAPKLVYT
jgi:hypothetical protein